MEKIEKNRNWLAQEMLDRKMFWSYNVKEPSQIPDKLLIETVLLYGDIVHLNALFRIFDEKEIRTIWENYIIIQEPRFHDLNIFLAWLYFNIPDPGEFIKKIYFKNNPYERLKREYAAHS